MTNSKTMFGGAVLAAMLALAGCGGGGEETTDDATAGAVDTSAGGESTGGENTGSESTGGTTGTATAAASPELIAAGGERFEAVCGLCHPGGEEDNGPSIKNIHWDAARMRTQIRNGSGRMRPIPATRLSDEDLEKVLAWLGTIGAVQ